MFFLAPLLAVAAGAAINNYAQNRAAQQQQNAINQMRQNQFSAKREQNQTLMDAIQQYKTEDRTQKYEQAQQSATDNLIKLIQAQPEHAQLAKATEGSTGQDYDLARAAATADSQSRAYKLAGLLGRSTAHADLFRNEAKGLAAAENKGLLIGQDAQMQMLIDQQKVQQSGQVSPWLSALGSGISSYGMSGFKW